MNSLTPTRDIIANDVADRVDLMVTAGRHEGLVALFLECLSWECEHGRRSKETLRSYASTLIGSKGWMAFLRGKGIVEPTGVDAYEFLSQRRSDSSGTCCNRHLAALSSCYRWLDKKGLYPAITFGIARFHVQSRAPRSFVGRDDLIKMIMHFESRLDLTSLTGLRDSFLVRLLYGTGLRLVSITRSDLADVSKSNDRWILRHQSKGSFEKRSIAILPINCGMIYERYLAERTRCGITSSALFIGLRPHCGSRLDVGSMRRIVYRLFESGGIRRRDDGGRVTERYAWGAHALRRSAAVVAVDANGIEAGQTFLGHASIDQTRASYAALDRWRVLHQVSALMDLPIATATE